MQRRNTVWNAVADYTCGLDNATTTSKMFININGLNNSIHNTGGKIITDPGKVSNYGALQDAFDTVSRIRNHSQWELINGMVDKDIRGLLSQSD